MNPKDLIVGNVCFGETPTEELALSRDRLIVEIKELQTQQDQLAKTVNLPKAIELMKKTLSKLTDKRNKIESAIATSIVNKATIIEDGIEEATREARLLKEEVERALISLKSGLFSYEEKLKVKREELNAVDVKLQITKRLLEKTVNSIEQKRGESLEELKGGLVEVEEARSKFEQEKFSFKTKQGEYRENLKGLERMSVTLDNREKLLNELEVTLNLERSKYKIEKEANEKRFSEVQESQRLTQADLADSKEKVEKLKEEMVGFKKSLLERENKIIKREEDLDHNWTLFLSEQERISGARNFVENRPNDS